MKYIITMGVLAALDYIITAIALTIDIKGHHHLTFYEGNLILRNVIEYPIIGFLKTILTVALAYYIYKKEDIYLKIISLILMVSIVVWNLTNVLFVIYLIDKYPL